MLFVYDKNDKSFNPSQETDFKTHDILERRDIEKWVMDFPQILGEELLIVTTEYDKFDKTSERLDLLCFDKKGKLVIVELKRDASGKNVDLQAIKYAAYCSTLALKDVVELRKKHLEAHGKSLNDENVEDELFDFVEDEAFEKIDDKPRIMLVSKEFRPEVTSAVLWLRKFNLDISCIKLTPYKIDEHRIGLVSSTLIPLPEAEEYIIKSERKESVETTFTRTQQEYVEFYQRLSEKFGKQVGLSLAQPRGEAYYLIPSGLGGVHFEWGFHGRPRSSFGVELHFEKDRESNASLISKMAVFKDEIEKATGEQVIVQKEWGKSWARLYLEKNEGKMTKELEDWALEKMVILYKLLKPKLQALKI